MLIAIQALVVSAALLVSDAPTPASRAISEGNAHFESADFEKALTAYQRAVELEPKLALAHYLLARTHEHMLDPPAFYTGEEDEKAVAAARAQQIQHRVHAIAGYRAALAADLGKVESIDYRAAARKALIELELGASGREEAALEQATLFARENPGDPRALTVLATTLEKVGRVEQAEATFREMTRGAPGNREACEAFAAFYMRPNWDTQSKYAQGLEVVTRCAELSPTDPRGHYTVATSYWDVAYRTPDLSDAEVGRLADQGLKAIARALALDAEYIEALTYKGLLLRLKARVATNPAIRAQLVAEAQAMQKRAVELKRKRNPPQE
jgi:tetratricopeptide (TPR) repeat protein